MPADPFALFGIERPDSAPPPPAPKDNIPTMTVRASRPSVDPLANFGVTPEDAVTVEPQAQSKPAPVGVMKQLGYGTKEGFGGLANTPLALPHALSSLGVDVYNLITGKSAKAPEQAFNMGQMPEPQGFAEHAARAIGQGLPALPLMGMGAAVGAPTVGRGLIEAGKSMALNALPTVGGQVAGEAAAQVAPEGYEGTARLGAALAGGFTGAGAQALGGMAYRGAARMAGSVGIGPKTTFQGEGGPTVRATEQQVQAARGRLEEAANQSGPDGVQRFEDALNRPFDKGKSVPQVPYGSDRALGPYEAIPGSKPTTAQVAPLSGIAKLEDTQRVNGAGPQFMARDAAQNTARVASVQKLRPDSDPAAVGQYFKDQLAELDKAGVGAVDATRSRTQARTDTLGGQRPATVVGQEMRGAINEALDPVQVERRKLWAAIDPDGKLAVDTVPLRDAAKGLLAELTPSDVLTAGENGALQHAAGLADVVPFRELQQLRKNIGDSQRAAAFGQPLTTAGERRLSIIKNALDEALAASVGKRAASEAEQLSSGAMAPEQTMLGRLSAEGQDGAAQSAGMDGGARPVLDSSAGVRGQVSGRVYGPGETSGIPAGAGNANAGGQSGQLGAGNRQLAASPADEVARRPQSLVDFLIAKGGLKDQGGDLKAIGADSIHHRQGGRLVNPRGQALDYAREAAEQEGFLRPGSTVNDLLNAVGEEVSGRPIFRQSDQAAGDAWANMRRDAERQSAAYDRARRDVGFAESDAGVRLSDAEIEHATNLTMRGTHPEQAIMDAIKGREEVVLQRNAQQMGMGRPGLAPGATQAEMPVSKPQLAANFDEKAAERYAAAREATLREKERFGRGPVGNVLARGANGAPNRVLDADVPRQFFTGGPSEPAKVQAYFKAVGGEGRGVALAREYLVSDLRKAGAISQDGMLDAGKFARWQSRHGETVKLFPGLDKEFASAQAAQRAFDDVQAAHAAALKDYQSGIAKNFLNEEPARAVQKILNSQDRVKLMQQAIGKVQGNADALQSLKAHVIDYMIDKLTNSAKATEANAATPGITEVGALRADKFNDWISDNNAWLKKLYGGQGMQNLIMVGSDLRRQQLRGIASSGSATAEREAAKTGGFRQHLLPTALAIVGEKIGETAAAATGMHGVYALGASALGVATPIIVHAMRQVGISTVNDLVREAMLHPSLARELMARPRQGSISGIAARRIGNAMLAVGAAQEGTPKE